ncbi:glycosyltransferase [Tenacibaculum sp. S7007]|uniref:Glycosyltransferase n=1 Tax=Tenacibaculum pelagium TaxID=2759527 RepID=A0A839API8_9FLAO|nr:glycosyltransferase [Tenacibaculum pelagium]MBA6156290.1 glycosyltransferase [Tenacibaculum pelagium]
MRVLHVSVSDGLGGAAIAAKRLSELMNKYGGVNSNMLVLIKNTNSEEVKPVTKLQFTCARVNNKINNTLTKKKKCYGLFSFAYLGLDLSKHELVKKADVIYIHWVNNGMMSWKGIEKIILLQKPVFLFNHDMWYFTGGCHQSNGCEQFKFGCPSCVFFETIQMKNIVRERFLKKKNTYENHINVHHIFPSTIFYTMGLESNILNKKNIHYIPNILDTSKFIPIKEENKNKKIKVLYGAMGGKTNLYKGWSHFRYLLNTMEQEVLENVEFLLFGYDFDQEELNELKVNVKSYGMVNSEEKMIEVYQNADVFIFPSLQESFGQTLFEAMSCGVIPVAYDVGAARDLIIHKFNGYLLSVGDKKGLVKSVYDLIKKDNLSQMKKRVRSHIEKNFLSESLVQKHVQLLKIK